MNIAIKPPFVWTEKNTAEAARMWNDGLSATEVAVAIGASRNAVMGKAHRNPDLFRSKEGYGKGWRAGRTFSDNPKPRPSVPRVVLNRAAKDAKAEQEAKVAAERQAVREARSNAAEYDAGRLQHAKTLVDLGSKECHWPINEGGPFLYCAAEATEGDRKGEGTYCRCHYLRRLPSRPVADMGDI